MSYLNALAALASPVGNPPPSRAASIGAPAVVAAVPEITAPAYDAAKDASWAAYLDPNDHAFRNMVNGLDDSERQLLLQKLMQVHSLPPPVTTARTPGTF